LSNESDPDGYALTPVEYWNNGMVEFGVSKAVDGLILSSDQ
jgi:hypothetical protein